MMDLTPLEVRKKKGDFKRQMRGYDPALVDDFLDLVADRLEQVVRENMNNAERVARLEAQVTEYRDREKALTEALVSAQQMREEIRRQVEKEAELARREAEADAENIRVSAVQAREREEEAIRRLRARQAQLVQSYRGFLERELAELSVMAETLEVTRTAAPATPGGQRTGAKPRAATKPAAPQPAKPDAAQAAPGSAKPAAAPADAAPPRPVAGQADAASPRPVAGQAGAGAAKSAVDVEAGAAKQTGPSAEVPQHLPPPGPPPEQMPVPLPDPVPVPQPTPMPRPTPMPEPVPSPTPMPEPTPAPIAPAARAERGPDATGTAGKPNENRADPLRSIDAALPLTVIPTAGLAEEFVQLPTLDPGQSLELTIEPAPGDEDAFDPQIELEDGIEDIVEDEPEDEEDEGAWVSSLLERKGQ